MVKVYYLQKVDVMGFFMLEQIEENLLLVLRLE